MDTVLTPEGASAAGVAGEVAVSAAEALQRLRAALMGMNNIYYRFLHLIEDEHHSWRTMPARLRMNALAAPGIDARDFELACLAVSALNGCGPCIQAHERKLRGQGLTREAIHDAVRIAAVMHAVGGVLDYTAH